MDEEIERILARKATKLYRQALEQRSRELEQRVEEDPADVLRRIARGDRAAEIIDTALQLYGDAARQVFARLVEMHRSGALPEVWDYEIYQVLEQVGLHVPIRTRVRIVKRGGREESLGEALRGE